MSKKLSKVYAMLLCIVLGGQAVTVFANDTKVVNGQVAEVSAAQSLSLEEKQAKIVARGEALSLEDFVAINREVELNAAQGIMLSDEEVLDMLISILETKPVGCAQEIFGKTVTDEELKLVAKYPLSATKVFSNAEKASSEASTLYASNTLYLGNGDAFRHAYWNALNTKSVGESRAKAFADAHESETAEGADKTMDLYNNEIGRAIGKEYKSSSNSVIKEKVVSYCDEGKLYRVINNELVATDNSGKN